MYMILVYIFINDVCITCRNTMYYQAIHMCEEAKKSFKHKDNDKLIL